MIVAVQRLLGHADINTTAIYIGVERQDLRRAIDTLERRRGEPPVGGTLPP